MEGGRGDQESKQKQIKDRKMGMDEGNQRRRGGVGSKERGKMSMRGKDGRMDVRLDCGG